MRAILAIGAFLLVAYSSVSTAGLSGTYIDESDTSNTLVLTENPDGSVSGNFEGDIEALPIRARRNGDRLSGTIGSGADAQRFTAKITSERIVFEVVEGGETFRQVFVRADSARDVAAPAKATNPARTTAPAKTAAAKSGRNVIVNDQKLTDEQLAEIERTYRVRIVDAEYWYDKVSGAWGIKGGPTRGFVYSGLNLGGPLKADASGGGTNVFINGRELHPLDVQGLRRCMEPLPGRWFVLADGTAGYEGGPPLFNVVAMCSSRGTSGRAGGWVCDGGSCGTDKTVTGPYAVTSEGGRDMGVYTGQGLVLTPN